MSLLLGWASTCLSRCYQFDRCSRLRQQYRASVGCIQGARGEASEQPRPAAALSTQQYLRLGQKGRFSPRLPCSPASYDPQLLMDPRCAYCTINARCGAARSKIILAPLGRWSTPDCSAPMPPQDIQVSYNARRMENHNRHARCCCPGQGREKLDSRSTRTQGTTERQATFRVLLALMTRWSGSLTQLGSAYALIPEDTTRCIQRISLTMISPFARDAGEVEFFWLTSAAT
ncbi:hypothetical protein CALCODRAFT_92953 [Calocera cornea HHB12733]|uniref:Uncharacterized protein n=1 Tax=Calocera cornea HHB12733 TaxID=1353952 RepID=A0A165D944_9BASI|nr:hypothetical protein CALCODRAFT_92953 [Calocera cornea HHB12733]